MLEKRKKRKPFSARNNTPEGIYGPPEMLKARRNGTPCPSPKDNIPEDVYGPPEWFENNRDTSDVETESDDPDTSDKNNKENDK